MFCSNFLDSQGEFQCCRASWCGRCYQKAPSDNFHVNKPLDEFGEQMYSEEQDSDRFNVGVNGAHLLVCFQCDLCIFRNLLAQTNPKPVTSEKECMMVIRRMNLDLVWSGEPSTILNNRSRNISKIISNCNAFGFDPQLPQLGPCPLKDSMGFGVFFSMLVHSRRPGKHSKFYTQFATIRQQRAAFTNLYMASGEASGLDSSITNSSHHSRCLIGKCPSNSIW